VDRKTVGGGEKALIYLGRYLYRGVIREQDILSCSDGQVTFRYRNGHSGQWERRTVPGAQVLWLVLQHVLPQGNRTSLIQDRGWPRGIGATMRRGGVGS
jgi:hypothetical protein